VTADATNDLIIRRLKELGRHWKTDQHVHSYPHCWRCKSKLIYYARDSWFVRTSAIKDRLVELNRGINWQPPEVGSGRFGEWLANNVDWALSRDRYWGTPLPVWISDVDASTVEVIGSFAELEAKVGRKLPDPFDPHKPDIDLFTWPAPNGGTMRRVPEVIDTWFDSGSMPYAQWHWPFENEDQFRRHFPADFICEGVDQTRGWFYSLLAIGATVFDQAAFKNVVVNELVLDAHGQKMSKSKGNTIDPWEAVREFGADTVRLYLLASSQVWLPKPFDRAAIPDVAGGFFNTLRNAYQFFALYAGADSTAEPRAASDAERLLDRWIASRLESTVAAVNDAWSAYDATTGIRALIDFVVDDLSNWYVRLSRPRFWAPDRSADPAAVAALESSLVAAARMLAPVAPFASDWLHRALAGGSVHLADFPLAVADRQDPELERAMDAVRRLASLGRAARESGNLRVRQSLAAMRIAVPKGVDGSGFRALLGLLAQEVNVKRIDVVASDTELVRLKGKANFRGLGKRFGKRTPAIAALIAELGPDALRQLEAGSPIAVVVAGESVTIEPDDAVIEREVTTDWLVQSAGPFVAAVDPVVTAALKKEGLAREVVSRVQRLRKDVGYEYTTRIVLGVAGSAPVLDAVREHQDFIASETLARDVQVGVVLPRADGRDESSIEDHQVTLTVQEWTGASSLPK
jgi:isoleucyl-tRNA synthetase